MVTVKYNGRAANNMINHIFAKIIATELDLNLLPYSGNFSHLIDFDGNNGKLILDPIIKFDDSVENLEDVLKFKNSGIFIDGYYQKSKFYVPYREQIKSWIKFKNPLDFTPNKNDICIHIRRSDFGISQNLGFVNLSFYTNILDNLSFDKIYVFGGNSCNDPNFKCIDNTTIKTFEKYNPIYSNLDAITEFQMMMKFRRVFQSMSTFSWLSYFLSDYAEEIYTPITIGGYWDLNNKNINLRVDDPRYVYIDNVKVEKW